MSLGAGEPASESLEDVRDLWIDCRFFGAGLCAAVSGRSEEGAIGRGGNASEPRLDPDASDGVATGGGAGVGAGAGAGARTGPTL